MAELKREPIVTPASPFARDSMTCFDEDHTHSDILRYVIADLGIADAKQLMIQICREHSREERKLR